MPVNPIKKNKGYTLIEIMISLVLGLIVVGTTLTIYISTIKGSSDTVKSARLNYDLESAMQFMMNDIRRAGYWSGAVTGSNALNNPFMLGGANIIISNATGVTVNSCILYSYDGDTTNGSVDEEEYYGFKLEDDTIKIRHNVAGTAAADLTCNAGSWENILDTDNIEITALTFSSANSQCLNTSVSPPVPCTTTALTSGDTGVESREIQITLTGNVKNDSDVNKTLTSIVKVRNNRIYTQ